MSYQDFKTKFHKKAKKEIPKKEKIKKIRTKGKSNAKQVAKKTLKETLRKSCEISLTLDGDVKYTSGSLLRLDESFGRFAGKYLIDKCVHSVTGDYTVEITAFKIFEEEKEGE